MWGERLASWFTVWHPRYRGTVTRLAILALLLGAVAYAENVLITALSRSFSGAAGGDTLLRFFARAAEAVHWPIALVALVVYAGIRVTRTLFELAQLHAQGSLKQRSRSDLEGAILGHLLRKDDTFFASRPPAEILNRLTHDIDRVIDSRVSIVSAAQGILVILGNLAFFVQSDWRLAVLGLGICGASAWWMQRLTKPVSAMDQLYLGSDDRVKARFEDLLRAAPEVQVGDLVGLVSTDFSRVQQERRGIFMRFVTLNARLYLVSTASYLLAFVSLCLVALYFMTGHEVDLRAALVPAILRALPELFTNSTQLVMLGLSWQLAATSKARLLEYDTETDAPRADTPSDSPTKAPPIELDNVTYRFKGQGGEPLGGVVDISTTFRPGAWTAIVGGAGAGKSTLLQLLLGRVHPTSGAVRIGGEPLSTMTAARRAAYIAIMPQTVALLDTTIRENLLLGRPEAEVDLSLVEQTGLGAISRTKALAILPVGNVDDLSNGVCAARKVGMALLRERGIQIVSFEEGGVARSHWVLEAVMNGRCNRDVTKERLLARAARAQLDAVVHSELGRALEPVVRAAIARVRPLLALPTYQQFATLTPVGVDEDIWTLRASLLDAPAELTSEQQIALVRVGLTLTRSELADGEFLALQAAARESRSAKAALERLLGDAVRGFDATRIHPFLTWRENIVFGDVITSNGRAEQQVDQALLDLMKEHGLWPALTRAGLEYAVGRGGTKLSGGQRQLVALTRTLMRKTPVVILDEPTSALDPASRSRVTQLLRDWREERVIITVTHDPELVKAADDVRMLEAGRLAASGSFDELRSSSPKFRDTLKVS